MLSDVSMWVGFVLIGLGVVGGWFPVWKSAMLSPESIQRRVFWVGSALGLLALFLSLLPDLSAALFGSSAMALGIIGVAFTWTGHIKIAGRIYAALPSNREPDNPPALSYNDRD
jgi:hypothetical protein